MEEKPAMSGAGDDSSSSFLDFSGGGGGYDPNQPGSSRDLVPAGNQAVAAGAAGQKVGHDPNFRDPPRERARGQVAARKSQGGGPSVVVFDLFAVSFLLLMNTKSVRLSVDA